jgi:hypothetical protein
MSPASGIENDTVRSVSPCQLDSIYHGSFPVALCQQIRQGYRLRLEEVNGRSGRLGL